MEYLEVGHTPTLISHVHCHDAEPFCLEFAVDLQRTGTPHRRTWRAVGKAREDQPVAMNIGPDEQHRAPDGVEAYEVRPAAQIAHMNATMIAPGIQIEARSAVL